MHESTIPTCLLLCAVDGALCRRQLPERKPPTAAANAPNKNKEERLQGILQHRNINIKVHPALVLLLQHC